MVSCSHQCPKRVDLHLYASTGLMTVKCTTIAVYDYCSVRQLQCTTIAVYDYCSVQVSTGKGYSHATMHEL